jgi:hypothetical protein
MGRTCYPNRLRLRVGAQLSNQIDRNGPRERPFRSPSQLLLGDDSHLELQFGRLYVVRITRQEGVTYRRTGKARLCREERQC